MKNEKIMYYKKKMLKIGGLAQDYWPVDRSSLAWPSENLAGLRAALGCT